MRLAIISDIHYGESENYGKINPETTLNTRLEDIDRAFNRYIDYVLEPKNKIDIAVIAGDLYKSRKPTPTQQLLFTRGLLRLLESNRTSDKKIRIIVFTGNHDVQRTEMAHAASSVAELTSFYSDTLWIEDKPRNYLFEEGEEKVLLCTIPYLYKQKLKMSSNEQVVEFYRTLIREALAMAPDATCKVFTGHQTLEGCSIAEYQDINSFNEIIVPLDAFEGFDFVSQGHIHRYQVLKKSDPTIVYQGNPLQLEFDEVHDKGFIVYDTKLKKHKRVIIKSPVFKRIEVDTSENDQDATEAIVEALTDHKEEIVDAIVKIRATIKEADLPIRVGEFKDLLQPAKYYAGLEKIVIRENRARSTVVTKDNSTEAILLELSRVRNYDEVWSEEFVSSGLEICNQADEECS